MKIVTAVVNNLDFIEIQYHTLKKYVTTTDGTKPDFEFIVFNDAKEFPDFTNGNDITLKGQIDALCARLSIECITVPNEGHKTNMDAALRCADSMNFILKYQICNPDQYLLLDSDMFLVDYFDINKYSEYDCAVVLQSRPQVGKHYFWNGIYYFDMMKIKNIHLLNWSCCAGCDVGGMMHEWLKKQLGNSLVPNTDTIRWTNQTFHTSDIYFIKHLWSCSWNEGELPDGLKVNTKLVQFLMKDGRNQNGKFFCEIYDNVFLHYRAGGNWRKEGIEFHQQYSKVLKEALI